MSDYRLHSRASGPPSLGSGRSGASGQERPARNCSCPPPDPTPHRSAHGQQPTAPGGAPTSPPQPTETDHSPVAGRVSSPARHRLSALGCSRSSLADPSLSRLGPLRLPLARCPPSRPGQGLGHPCTESRRQLLPNGPRSRPALDHRDDAQAVPPRATARPAANPPPTPASTPTQVQPQRSPPTTPRHQGERPATPRPAPDDPPHEPSSTNSSSPATTTRPQTTATASRSPHSPPGARDPADERRRRTRPQKQPPAHNRTAPTPSRPEAPPTDAEGAPRRFTNS
ncbi:hypothetical protein OK074_2808 [Actinobacteria bacterium OK074]|nr:hypothetical protein OK074_2808 [Actinobacteria bacterium OK074]